MSDNVPGPMSTSRYRWTIIAFVFAGFISAAFAGWQLFETSPRVWCVLAKEGSAETRAACLSVLLRLLDIKDHAVIGLLVILGLTILSVVVVALGVKLKGHGPGDLGFDIDRDDDTQTVRAGDATVTGPIVEKQ
ncbi:MAG: hypothetical protein ACTHJR_11625 [Sphingomonas sp.]|uniref:hypothetical protein n=1 Tax=Sphingomonas sp. TaxID=28214 RepID=UPI003F7D676E